MSKDTKNSLCCKRSGEASDTTPAEVSKRPKLNQIHWEKHEGNLDDTPCVTKSEWVQARKSVLAKEKELSREYDAIVQARKNLPFLKLDKAYNFVTDEGNVELKDLFGEYDTLIVQHLMFGEEDEQCCSVCSFFTDGYNGHLRHLSDNGVSFYCTAPASLGKLSALKESKKWDISMASCVGASFNIDMGFEGTEEQKAAGDSSFYNYGSGCGFPSKLYPGLSVFHKHTDNSISLTYQAMARGMDVTNCAHHLFDMVPRGRNGFMAK